MKKLLKNPRYYVIAIFLLVAILGLMVVPNDDLSDEDWKNTLIISKGIAIAALYVAAMLTKTWYRNGKLPELDENE